MKARVATVIAFLLVAGMAWTEPDGDAVLEQARQEYQNAVAAEGRDDGPVYRYERHTTESESWSMESDTEPEWWEPGVANDQDAPRVTHMPLHLSIFGESFFGPVSANIAVSPLISAVESVHGIQAAGLISTVDDSVTGFQLAGVLSVSDGEVRGVQAAGVFAAAEGDVHGLQVAGVFNTADTVRGAQVGLVNIADDVRGLQVGLVNISDNMHGLPIGLINIVKNGIRNFTVWFEDSGYNYVGYQYGTNNVYTLAYGGMQKDDWFEGYDSLVTGLGLGIRLRLGSIYVDGDLSAKHVAIGETNAEKLAGAFRYDATTYPAARLTAGLSLGRRLSFFAGAGFDVHLPGYTCEGRFHTGEMIPLTFEHVTAELYPKYFLGFSL